MTRRTWKAAFAAFVGLSLFGAGALVGANQYKKPASLVHVITFKRKDGMDTPENLNKVRQATETLASECPGLTNVWMKAVKVQGPDENFKHAIVMEFKDQAAFTAYADHPSHKKWEAAYMPLRGESRTHDITN